MKIVTWNINGVRARLGNLHALAGESAPDIVCLQEIKSLDDQFPRAEVEALGYKVETHGQKGFNGVALLSKLPFDEVSAACRATTATSRRGSSRACSRRRGRAARRLALSAERQPDRTREVRLQARLDGAAANAGPQRGSQLEEPLVLAGDFNVIPEPADARFPENWVNDALFQPETRAGVPAFCPISASPMPSARSATIRAVYTFWDYQAGAWQKNNGIRIDHLMLSPEAADRLAAGIDRKACARLGKAVRPRAGGDRAAVLMPGKARPVLGGCHCGDVRYACTEPYRYAVHCHCGTCRRSSGAAFMTWVCLPRPAFRLTRGLPVRRASSPGVERAFCTGCGTQLLMDYAGSDTVDVAVGTLDEPAASARATTYSLPSGCRWPRGSMPRSPAMPGSRRIGNVKILLRLAALNC